MGWPVCNTTLEDERLSEVPVWHDWTFHDFGIGLSAIFAGIAIIVSFVLMGLHARYYSRPNEQRHIIRILFMVPVYAAVSFLSFKYYWHSIYFEVLRDCYEAFAIASFFSLLCSYIADDLHNQKQYFRTIQPKKWIFPIPTFQRCCGGENGIFRTPRSGLTWFNVIWVAVFQYCFIRVTMTVVAVVTQVFGRYCLESLNPAFSHIWIMVIESIAVTIAMYCLIQFFVQIRADIKQHSPLKKITAIKLVIFLSFWQTIIISFLTSSGAIKTTDKLQSPDIKVGIPAMLLCIEMALFSIFHIFAFSWRPYIVGSKSFESHTVADTYPGQHTYHGGFLGLSAILDAFNPWDLIKAVGRAGKWLFRDRKTRHSDPSYNSTQLHRTVGGHGASESVSSTTSLPGKVDVSVDYKPQGHTQVLPEEGRTLLSASAPMPRYPPSDPPSYQPSPAIYPVQNTEYFEAGDIGVAQSTSDQSRYHVPPTSQSQQRGYVPYRAPTNESSDSDSSFDKKFEAGR